MSTPPDEGFGSGLEWGTSPALLVIDMMQAYFTEGSPLCLPNRAAVEGCARLLATARAHEIPVFHTRVAYSPGLADAGLFVRKVPALALLVEGDPLGRFEPDVAPEPGETVVVKHYASAFFGTSLASTLRAAQPRHRGGVRGLDLRLHPRERHRRHAARFRAAGRSRRLWRPHPGRPRREPL